MPLFNKLFPRQEREFMYTIKLQKLHINHIISYLPLILCLSSTAHASVFINGNFNLNSMAVKKTHYRI